MDRDINYLPLLGPILIGSLFAYLCVGAYIVQLFHYVLNPVKGNQKRIHVLVIAVALAELAGVVIATENSWRVLCLSFSNRELIFSLSKWSVGAPVTYGFVAFLVQSFYAWQIYQLVKGEGWGYARFIIPGSIEILSLLQFVSALAISVQYAHLNKDPRAHNLRPTVIVQRSASLACDIMITCAVTLALWRYKMSVTIPASHKILNGLIINAFENMAVTTLFVAFSLIFYLSHPHDFLHQAFQQLVGRLYANVFMASLNGRSRRRQTLGIDVTPEDVNPNGTGENHSMEPLNVPGRPTAFAQDKRR